jgi:hypothetical protein
MLLSRPNGGRSEGTLGRVVLCLVDMVFGTLEEIPCVMTRQRRAIEIWPREKKCRQWNISQLGGDVSENKAVR